MMKTFINESTYFIVQVNILVFIKKNISLLMAKTLTTNQKNDTWSTLSLFERQAGRWIASTFIAESENKLIFLFFKIVFILFKFVSVLLIHFSRLFSRQRSLRNHFRVIKYFVVYLSLTRKMKISKISLFTIHFVFYSNIYLTLYIVYM